MMNTRTFIKVFAISRNRVIDTAVQKIFVDAHKLDENTVLLNLQVTVEAENLANELCSHKDWEVHAISQVLVAPNENFPSSP